MANKGSKPKEATEQKEATEEIKKDGKKGGLMDSIIEQSINEFTRPLIQKINPATIALLRKIGADKFLPILSVGLQTFFKDKFGGKTGDIIAEISAELRRVILETSDDGGSIAKTSTAVTSGIEKTVFSVIFNSEISDQTVSLAEAWVKLFKNDLGEERPEKEKKQIFSLIDKMGPQELLVFLTQGEQERKTIINSFIKKTTEKPFEEAVKEFKDDVKKLVANAKTLYEEILVPVGETIKPHLQNATEKLKKVDNRFANNGDIGKEIIDLKGWSKQFRDRRK